MGRKRQLQGEVIESFYGVYLLLCANPRYKGRTYIGFTVDPNRRIRQHNLGKEKGGAHRTHNKGPWDMVLVIHGFPNDISALRFEWAWQHPDRSRRLRHVKAKSRKESSYEFALRVLSEMLRVGPWCRLPLSLRWLVSEHAVPFPADRCAPVHMPICYGPIVSKKLRSSCNAESEDSSDENECNSHLVCCLCGENLLFKDQIMCLVPDCGLRCHVLCLSKRFLSCDKNHIIPVDGVCPECSTTMLWGDLVRKKQGCYSHLGQEDRGALSGFETDLNTHVLE